MATLTSNQGFFLSTERIRAFKAKSKSSTVISISKAEKAKSAKLTSEVNNKSAFLDKTNAALGYDIDNAEEVLETEILAAPNDRKGEVIHKKRGVITYAKADPSELKKYFTTPLKDFFPIMGFK